ncbi:MAG: CNNM domain-containing protein, partial [Egibacteraceae bacterium]
MNGLSTQLGLIAVLVLLNGLLAGSEIALISLREDQRQRLGGRGRAGAALVRLTDDPNRFLATIQIGITLTGFLASATAAVTLAEPLVEPLAALGAAARPTAVALVTVALTAITLVFGELAPKRLALEHGEGWALR